MAYKYLYIDDNDQEVAQGIITGLELYGELEIEFQKPMGKWEDERARIISDSFKQYDGLILDLNLEDYPNTNNEYSLYKGSSLAQEIRNISKSGEIREIPIILLSATINLEKYFDKTNEDLFDIKISREDLVNIFVPFRNKLIALSEGYQLINTCKSDENLNNLLKHDLILEDSRFVGELKSIMDYPVHSISNFLLKNFLERDGILISEQLLSTRLGIDISRSKDWPSVLQALESSCYNGVFHEGWRRWWMSSIDTWWQEKVDEPKSLRGLKANERVEILKRNLRLNDLLPFEKNPKSRSECFWTNCYGSGIPIDTIDGLLISNQDNIFSWQDKRYISYEEALRPTNKGRWKRISPLEEYKLEQLKIRYPNERPKQL